MTKKELEDARVRHTGEYFPSRFNFLANHSGLRPGQCHFLLGTSGCGKSSLARAVQIDAAKDKRVYIHLSEEKIDDYKYKLNSQLRDKSILSNIFLESENQRENHFRQGFDAYMQWFQQNITEFDPEVIFFDNLTTSYLWTSLGLKGQEEALVRFNNLAEDTGKTFFFIIHTKKDITDTTVKSLIQPEDCRGTQQTALMAPYFYVFQNFKNEFGNNATIRVAKSRFHDMALNRFYALNYSSEHGTYLNDREISFNDLKTLFQDRYKFTENKQGY
jgi:energy-coupling factor transporter ATP-binding protein EcfA2